MGGDGHSVPDPIEAGQESPTGSAGGEVPDPIESLCPGPTPEADEREGRVIADRVRTRGHIGAELPDSPDGGYHTVYMEPGRVVEQPDVPTGYDVQAAIC